MLRGSNPECVASRATRYGGWAAALRRRSGEGLRSATSRQWGRRCFRLLGGTARTSGSCCLACSTWAWARGVPASGRSWRPLHGAPTPMHIYARAHGDGVGDALPQRSSSSRSSLPRLREMSLLLAFGTRRSERRSANIDDAALVEECVETWEGGAAMRGQEGKVSSPLRSRHPSVAPDALCPSAYAYEWDSRVSLTS